MTRAMRSTGAWIPTAVVSTLILGIVALAIVGFLADRRSATALSARYVTEANDACRTAKTRLDARPSPAPSPDPKARAERTRQATAILEPMAARLSFIAADRATSTLVQPWLEDWSRVIATQKAYARALEADDRAEIERLQRESANLTARVNAFAERHAIDGCVF